MEDWSQMDFAADIRSYYEQEARLGRRRAPKGQRLGVRDQFIELLLSEGRSSVLDLGAGPGRDGPAFIDAGLRYVGLDLAHGNGLLAASQETTVIQGSITAPPFRPACFDAGWSFSTLMHLPAAEVPAAVAALTVPLRTGAPLLVGQWGGQGNDAVDQDSIEGERRLFSRRTYEQNRRLLAVAGDIEHEECWESAGLADEEYHLFRIRIER